MVDDRVSECPLEIQSMGQLLRLQEDEPVNCNKVAVRLDGKPKVVRHYFKWLPNQAADVRFGCLISSHGSPFMKDFQR